MPKIETTTSYKKLCSPHILHRAWNHIYENSLQSKSEATRAEVREFKKDERRNIDRIYRQLLKKKFIFKDNKGFHQGTKKRPIVIAPVESRIVQRAILELLQDTSGIQKFLRSKNSYGAIKNFNDQKKGVPAAIEDVVQAIKNGGTAYYKSDIKSFFTSFSRGKVIDAISQIITDRDFISVLEAATNLEVHNILSFNEEDRKFFDFNTIGTPQGCCLSPLLGNILLYEFDMEMNKNNVSCFRYLDDFLIIGSGWKAVNLAFNKALAILEPLGLSAYRINDGTKKANANYTHTSFEFLGVEFKGKNIRPSKKSRDKLLNSIEATMNIFIKTDFSLQKYASKEARQQREHAWVATLFRINNKLLGWGNQYAFCNEKAIWGSIDAEIDAILKKYINMYEAKRKKGDDKTWRRMLGIHLISESKKTPIIWEN